MGFRRHRLFRGLRSDAVEPRGGRQAAYSRVSYFERDMHENDKGYHMVSNVLCTLVQWELRIENRLVSSVYRTL